jgi:hypothetical protein
LVRRQTAETHLLDQAVDLPSRDAVHIRLLHDRDKCLLGAAPRLQERRQITPRSELGDLQLDLPNPRVPPTLAIPIALS